MEGIILNDKEKLLVTLQNRIDEARNKGSKVTTIFISSLSKCLDLLKGQEAEPELEGGGGSWWYVCSECHGMISEHDLYCKHCGAKLTEGR